MHLNSELLFKKYALTLLHEESRVLEIGPDSFPSTYQRISVGRYAVWNTLDVHDDARLTYPSSDQYSFDVPSNSYDVVLSGQVIEHVKKVWVWMKRGGPDS